MKNLTFLLCSCLIAAAMQAQIIHVPADFPTIQQGINAANPGDTVLVSPGTYFENIYIDIGQNITLASLFLTTQDTSYISQTIIDGNQSGSVITLGGVDSSMVISGFTITNGNSSCGGGIGIGKTGILGWWGGSPSLLNLKIIYNSAGYGGGVCVRGGRPSLYNVTVSGNTAERGGGLCCLSDAHASGYSSAFYMMNVTITDNVASQAGGGLSLYSMGEINKFRNVQIVNNTALGEGGGIYFACHGEEVSFDSINRCSIYLNNASEGNDLFSDSEYITIFEVVVDTFTVLIPKEFHASLLSNFSFDIQHGYHDQVNGDLYVSPFGDDTNSGLTADEPLKNIHSAYAFMLPDPVNQNTIHLLEGIYSPSTNDEFFPVNVQDSIALEGISESLVILNADSSGRVIQLTNNQSAIISDLTITGGSIDNGGGIYCYNSNPALHNITIVGNSANISGGGIYCDNSDPILENVTLTDNLAEGSGGGIFCENSDPTLENVTITGNSAQTGGGIYCNPASGPVFGSVSRSNIYFNSAFEGNDLYSESFVEIIVDTFSVLYPTNYYAKPFSNFSFDILHGKITQVNADLFVSPEGDNSNSGLNESDPLKNLQYAFSIIRADSVNKNCIRLLEGTYSSSSTGESFPINIPDYISLEGVVDSLVILDADSLASVILIKDNTYNHLSGLTITGGSATFGAGIYCYFSYPILENVTISGNNAYSGGGIFCENSDPTLENVILTENSASGFGGGGIKCHESSPTLKNVQIKNNEADHGGGIACLCSSPYLENVLITDNLAQLNGGGIAFVCNPGWGTPSTLVNVTITGNSASYYGGGLSCLDNPSPTVVNGIVWNNLPYDIYGGANISYSNIQGGWQGEGNINEDPQFVGSGDHPYALSDGSPCIDAGIPDTNGLNLPPWDIIGNVRVWDGDGDGVAIVDMGAYEYGSVPVGIEEPLVVSRQLSESNQWNCRFSIFDGRFWKVNTEDL